MQGLALLILSLSCSLVQLKAYPPLRVLTLTRLFSDSLCRSRPSPIQAQVGAKDGCQGLWGHHELKTVLTQAPNGKESFGLGPEQAASPRKSPYRFGGLSRTWKINTKRN